MRQTSWNHGFVKRMVQPYHLIGEEEQQGGPEHVRDDHVHAHVPLHQRYTIGETVLRGDHFAGKQKQHDRLQVEADGVQDARPYLRQDDPIDD